MAPAGTYFGGMIDDVRILRLSSGQVLQPGSKTVGAVFAEGQAHGPAV